MIFEAKVNKKYKTGHLKVHVVMIPTPRDQLLSGLIEGRGDIAAAGLTITPERQEQVDFGPVTFKDVSEVVVTGPGGAPVIQIDSVADLAGREVFVRKSSSYWASLEELNKRFLAEGRSAVKLTAAPESLEDEDILEMTNAGLVQITVVDNYLANFWKQVLPDIHVHSDVAVRSGASLAPAIRKNSPKLMAMLAEGYHIKSSGMNQATRRYLKQTKYVKSATSPEELKRFLELVKYFKQYGDQYQLDWLMMVAQGYQESRLDQNAKSHVGAVGIMQVMPATGKDLEVGDIKKIEPNIHAGVKYVRFVIDEYYKDEPMTELDKTLFAFASYNCGPGRVRQLRAEAKQLGLDPNVWFGNVDRVAAKRIGRETVNYVGNIYKYAIAYQLAVQSMQQRDEAKEALKQ